MTDIENAYKYLERMRSISKRNYQSLSPLKYPYREAVEIMRNNKDLDEVDFTSADNQVCTVTRAGKYLFSLNVWAPVYHCFIDGALTLPHK